MYEMCKDCGKLFIMRKLKDIYYAIRRIFVAISDIPRNIKYFIQRGKRGCATCDWWSFDYYIAGVIVIGIKALKKYGTSLPILKGCNKKGEPNVLAKKRWYKILDNLIYTFETAQKIVNRDLHYIPSKSFTIKKYNKEKKFCDEISKEFPTIPARLMTKKESLRFEKGFDLFKEWFFCLWD